METKFYKFGVSSIVKKFGQDPVVTDVEGISAAPAIKVNNKMIILTDQISLDETIEYFAKNGVTISTDEPNKVLPIKELPSEEIVAKETERIAKELSFKVMSDTLLKVANVVFKSEDKTKDMKKVEKLLLEYDKQKYGV